MLAPINTGGKPAQMVWASISLDERGRARRSPLVIMERDFDALKRRSQLFMQDGAGILRSRAVADFLNRHHITPIDWPPYLSDLNLIEHLWYRL
jgi:transposase